MRRVLIIASLLAFPPGSLADVCAPAAGEREFSKCRACHSLQPEQHLMGPSLHGLLGRPAGSAEGFAFSAVLSDADFVWDEKNLSDFLADPMGYLPGTTMPFAGLKSAAQRDALLCLFQNESNRSFDNNGE